MIIGGQTKTPTISVLFERISDRLRIGGAGVVATSSSAEPPAPMSRSRPCSARTRSSVDFVLEGLAADQARVECRPVIDKTRPTTNNVLNAIISGGYRLLKLDTLDNRSISSTRSCSISPRRLPRRRPRRWCLATSPSRPVQPPDDPDADRCCIPEGMYQSRRQPGGRAAGTHHHELPRFRSHHAERARALRAGRSGSRHPAAGGGHFRRRAVQDADPRAFRRQRAC